MEVRGKGWVVCGRDKKEVEDWELVFVRLMEEKGRRKLTEIVAISPSLRYVPCPSYQERPIGIYPPILKARR